MADLSLLTMSEITETQIAAVNRLYSVIDPAGTPQDAYVPFGALLPEYYKVTPSVASNDLTLKITHLDGSDPSATNPLVFKIGDSWQVVTSNLSFTKAAATNWCNSGGAELATQPRDYFVYIIEETGASAGTKLGFSPIPSARTMSDFGNTVASDTYNAGGWTNFKAQTR